MCKDVNKVILPGVVYSLSQSVCKTKVSNSTQENSPKIQVFKLKKEFLTLGAILVHTHEKIVTLIDLNMESTMRFCPPNITIHDIWINNGVSTCFLETVNSSIVSLFILIFGIGQLIFYWRFATRISDHLPRNCLYNLQVLSHVRWVELCFFLWNLSMYNFKTFSTY